MSKKERFFFFGFGQSAKYFVDYLLNSKRKFVFASTNTKKTKNIYFKKKNLPLISLKIRYLIRI